MHITHRCGELNELADMLSRAEIMHDKDDLEKEISQMVDQHELRFKDKVFEEGSQLHKWQAVLANRGSTHSIQAQELGWEWSRKAKLQCWIRGAEIAADDDSRCMKDKLAALQEEATAEGICVGACDYCRTAEMYEYVSVVAALAAKADSMCARAYSCCRATQTYDYVNVVAATARRTRKGAKSRKSAKGRFTSVTSSKVRTRQTRSQSRSFTDVLKDASFIQQDCAVEKPPAVPLVQQTVPDPALAAARPLTSDRLLQAQQDDTSFEAIRAHLQVSGTEPGSRLSAARKATLRDYVIDDKGLIFRLRHGPHHQPKQVVIVPDVLVNEVIFANHEGHSNGHPGFVRTYQKVYDKFYWVGMYADVRRFINTCRVCQTHSRAPSEAPLAGHITATRPGQGWVIDVLHMVESEEGHTAILVAVDVFSRYALLMPMYTIDSEEAA